MPPYVYSSSTLLKCLFEKKLINNKMSPIQPNWWLDFDDHQQWSAAIYGPVKYQYDGSVNKVLNE